MNLEKLKDFVTEKLENELSDKLTYHGVHHTLGVLEICKQYVSRMNISDNDARLLYTAALMHDTGFIRTYDNHEDESIVYAKEILPNWNYSELEINKITGMIRATKIPQKPLTVLEQIMGDSDLDYLGTDLFYSIGETLFNELMAFNKISSREQWDSIQLNFLQKHKYHTPFAKEYREPIKQKFIKEISKKLR
ncbi:MAG: HD domain-containing protein [Prolixibacteraceae bacterium]|jgi:uncharacterized protein|nr:HD domain-containing protein [Prolixibacteraceae bacterium]MBT6767272.1 HD domain-containing protein [Prolixibacteraceae bacterium]MBT6999158.1 HD domain-containing protein [Prolixibacteraceae bacterium]MBT7395971.1 HD domain-containing protein [Prolixibacteraceae bacterium]